MSSYKVVKFATWLKEPISGALAKAPCTCPRTMWAILVRVDDLDVPAKVGHNLRGDSLGDAQAVVELGGELLGPH